MDTTTTITIGTLLSIVSALIGYSVYLRNIKKDVKRETQEEASVRIDDTKEKVQLNTKLDILLSNNTEIKGEIRDINNKFDTFKDAFNERLTRVEESAKQAHKRIDDLKQK